MTDTRHVQAIYRPRTADIRVINSNGDTLDVPEADVPDLVAALATAFGIPVHARELMLESGENAFSAR